MKGFEWYKLHQNLITRSRVICDIVCYTNHVIGIAELRITMRNSIQKSAILQIWRNNCSVIFNWRHEIRIRWRGGKVCHSGKYPFETISEAQHFPKDRIHWCLNFLKWPAIFIAGIGIFSSGDETGIFSSVDETGWPVARPETRFPNIRKISCLILC